MSGYKIAVFASGNGSNFQAIVDQVNSNKLAISIQLLVCDRPQAYVITRAHEAGIPVLCIQPKQFATKIAYEQAIIEACQAKQVDLLVLAGYMRLVTPLLIDAYRNRMINVHPSLLPAFPGMNAISQAYAAGVKVTGITVHIVDEGLDTGPIIAQQSVDVLPDEDEQTLTIKIHELEHQLLPQVIHWFSQGKVRIAHRQVEIVEP
jgi:phosphoribosylglycinamide formyltransferase-1